MELEEHESFFVIKAGVAYAFPIGDWSHLGISVAYDWKEIYGAWSAGLSIGKRL